VLIRPLICLSACRRAYLRNYTRLICTRFLCIVTVIRFCGGVAIRCVLPVLWMTSYLRMMARNRRHDEGVYSNWLNRGQHRPGSPALTQTDSPGVSTRLGRSLISTIALLATVVQERVSCGVVLGDVWIRPELQGLYPLARAHWSRRRKRPYVQLQWNAPRWECAKTVTVNIQLLLLASTSVSAFSAFSVGRQEEHTTCKKWVTVCWRGYLSGARCGFPRLSWKRGH